MMSHSLRRWPNIETTLAQRLVFAGIVLMSRACWDLNATDIMPTTARSLKFAGLIADRYMAKIHLELHLKEKSESFSSSSLDNTPFFMAQCFRRGHANSLHSV